jgi:16S rRNA processing protein RimM
MSRKDASELVNIGKIGSSVGLRGEVRVTLYSRDSDNLKEGKALLLERAAGNGASSPARLETVCLGMRQQNGRPVIRMKGIEDRTAADSLTGMELYIFADDLEELPEGEHYVREIIGYTVTDLSSGRDIGVLKDVIQNTAQSILDIRTPEGKQVLVPLVDEFVIDIDDSRSVIEVRLIPGFI